MVTEAVVVVLEVNDTLGVTEGEFVGVELSDDGIKKQNPPTHDGVVDGVTGIRDVVGVFVVVGTGVSDNEHFPGGPPLQSTVIVGVDEPVSVDVGVKVGVGVFVELLEQNLSEHDGVGLDVGPIKKQNGPTQDGVVDGVGVGKGVGVPVSEFVLVAVDVFASISVTQQKTITNKRIVRAMY